MNKKLYIYAASANAWTVDQQAPPLKDSVKELWGKSYRRISHFIELALVGAGRCVNRRLENNVSGGASPSPVQIQPDCELIFASGQGNVSQVEKVSRQIFKEGQAPMPFDFMHITNNMAPFYVAQALGLNSANLSIAHRAFPFETAVDVAAFRMQAGEDGKQVLIGAVDECAFPLHQHRRRLNLPADMPLAEGSHWLLAGSDAKHAIAQVEFCIFSQSLDELLRRLKDLGLDANCSLACGYGINAAEQQNLQQELQLNNWYNDRQDAAYHDTAAAFVVASFVDSCREKHPNQVLLYVNKSPQQRYCALAVKALSPYP